MKLIERLTWQMLVLHLQIEYLQDPALAPVFSTYVQFCAAEDPHPKITSGKNNY